MRMDTANRSVRQISEIANSFEWVAECTDQNSFLNVNLTPSRYVFSSANSEQEHVYELNVGIHNLAEVVTEVGRLDDLVSTAECTERAIAARLSCS